MKIIINSKEIRLRDKDVQVAKKALDRFLKTIRDGAVDNNMPTLYFTMLAVMKVKSSELISGLDPQLMTEILSLLDQPEHEQ